MASIHESDQVLDTYFPTPELGTPSDAPAPEDLVAGVGKDEHRAPERRYITRCLEYTQGNVTRAAEILDMHRQSLQHKLRQLGLGRRYVSVSGEAQDNADS